MQSKNNILIVDDERKIVEVIESYLEMENYRTFAAFDGRNAYEIFKANEIALIILDLMLPDIQGEDFCIKIRKKSNVPIIMLTAKVNEESIIKGLGVGADDYITKPFSPRQLIARVNAVLRRTKKSLVDTKVKISDLIIDTEKYEVLRDKKVIELTKNEFSILSILAKNPNKTFTRYELINNIFGFEYNGFERTIDTHIKNLRSKIELNSKEPKYIVTVHGVGYRFGNQN